MDLPLKRVLIVDDEPDILIVAQYALEALGGLTVSPCESGEEALKQAPAFLPDLIVTDMMMPRMDGIQTLQALRVLPEARRTPVVFMTARTQPQEVAQYKECGALAVIGKPFDPTTLHQELCAIWAEHSDMLEG